MKLMNEYEDRKTGLKERAIRKVGEELVRMAGQKTCLSFMFYEPELSDEMIKEMIGVQ